MMDETWERDVAEHWADRCEAIAARIAPAVAERSGMPESVALALAEVVARIYGTILGHHLCDKARRWKRVYQQARREARDAGVSAMEAEAWIRRAAQLNRARIDQCSP